MLDAYDAFDSFSSSSSTTDETTDDSTEDNSLPLLETPDNDDIEIRTAEHHVAIKNKTTRKHPAPAAAVSS